MSICRSCAKNLLRSIQCHSLVRSFNAQVLAQRIPTTQTLLNTPLRSNYSTVAETGDAGETRLTEILKDKFPNAVKIHVEDISGGCGSMYEVHVESPDFSKMRTVAQHKLVTNALKEEVAKMHGLRIFTTAPK